MIRKLIVVLVILTLAGCSTPKATEAPGAVYTAAALTVSANITQTAASLPTATPTAVPTNTAAPTATLAPTATVPLPTPTWVTLPPGKVTVPILLYYHVGDGKEDNLYYQWETNIDIPSADFRHQMQILKDAGYTSVTVSKIADVLLKGGELPAKPVAITFDVITTGIYNKAFPIMKAYGFVGTLYVTSNQVNGEGVLNERQIKELVTAGWEIGSRGSNGVDLTLDHSVLSDEISGSRLRLEGMFGVPVTSFSYPYGSMDPAVASRVNEWGYRSAVGLLNFYDHTLANLYYLPRLEVKNTWSKQDFVSVLPWQPGAIPTPDVSPLQGVQIKSTPKP